MANASLTKAQRQRKLGIECPDRLVWKSWEPGEEHVRKLVIKNVESRTQVITFTLPEHRTVFLTPFPEPITLSSGVSYELPVLFCPTELVEVHDGIDIQVKGRGAFTVALDCLTPFARIACAPKTYDFGFCAVRATSSNQNDLVKMTNTGTVPLDYYWEVPGPFTIRPANGHLAPGQAQPLRVSFYPTEACTVVCQAVCKMAELDEVIGTLQLSGVGKFPFIRLCPPGDGLPLNTAAGGAAAATAAATALTETKKATGKTDKKLKGSTVAVVAAASPAAAQATMDLQNAVTALVDFHKVPAGCTATRLFVVENPSPVPTEVVLHCSADDEVGYGCGADGNGGGSACSSRNGLKGNLIPLDDGMRSGAGGLSLNRGPFHIQPTVASIPAAGRQVYKISFKAANAGTLNKTICELRSPAGNTIRLGIQGLVVGPRVKISTSYLDFGDVDLNKVLPLDLAATVASSREAHSRSLVKHLVITNTSATQACHFQFLATTPGAAFRVEPATGIIAPAQSTHVRVTFQPTAPVHYLRRLLVLVQDSVEMLYVDAFGTAYRDDARPPPLTLRDIDAFAARAAAGMADCTPNELESTAPFGNEGGTLPAGTATLADMLQWAAAEEGEGEEQGRSNGLTACTARRAGTGRLPLSVAAAQLDMPSLHSSGPSYPQLRATSAGPFALDCRVLTFSRAASAASGGDGADSGAHVTAAQSITVGNASTEAAVATWAVPPSSAFTVSPQQLEVPAGGSAQFQVLFRSSTPSAQTQFLECYVNYTQMSSFRLIRHRAAVTPPQCLVLQCRRDGIPRAALGAAATAASATGGTRPNVPGQAGSRKSNNLRTAAAAAAAAATVPSMSVCVAEPVVNFPSCQVGAASFQVVSLVNNGDVPHLFELKSLTIGGVAEKAHHDVMALPDSGTATALVGADGASDAGRGGGVGGGDVDVGATFTCYPHTGLLPPHQRALMLLRFHPTCHARYSAEMQLHVYASTSSHQGVLTVALHGETDIPRLELVTSPTSLFSLRSREGLHGASLVFPPTCVTGEAKRLVWLSNPTSLAVEYQFVPSHELRGALRLEPAVGLLLAGERLSVTVYFAPDTARRFEGSLCLFTRDANANTTATAAAAGEGDPLSAEPVDEGEGAKEYLSMWNVLGEGLHGVVEVEPTEMDLGGVTGLEPQTVAITLYNSGLCEVVYEVRSFTCSEPAGWGHHASQAPTLRNHVGTLPARTHCVVLATIHAAAAGLAEYLVYVMIAGLGTDIARIPSPQTAAEAERHPHCRLTVRGTRPNVQVTDVRATTQLRSHLWRQLSIPALNRQLAAPVRPQDVAADAYAFHQFVEGLTPITMELAVGPQHALAATFAVRLENVGDCAADFSLWLPTESSVTEENWFTEDSALKDIQRVLDRRIIEVTPRSGTIPARGSTVLHLAYRFLEIGIHTLPVVLRVADGRRALLMLEGRTVPEGVSCLASHAASAEYELLPVALGDVEPPMQSVMVLDNPLGRAVRYTVDQQALRELAEANYGFPVLQCVNPTGVLPPRSMTELHWYFRPLQAKEYAMSVPISTCTAEAAAADGAGAEEAGECGESYTYTFVGRGYHPRKTSAEEVRSLTELAFLPIPPAPALPLSSSQPVALRPEALLVGAVPYFTLHRSCCTLVNHHPTDTFTFEFDTRHGYGDHMLTIEPARGRLGPRGGRVECRVSFYTGSTSQMLQWSVPCRLVNETAVEQAMAADGYAASSTSTAIAAKELAGASTHHNSVHPHGAAHASEYFAVDGLGLLQMRREQERDGGVSSGPVFTRTTCTKAGLLRLRQQQQQQRSGTKRVPVTAIPPESLGLDALSRQVLAGREEEETGAGVSRRTQHQSATGNSTRLAALPAEPVVSTTVELFLQARVMPVDEYERVYGRDSLHGAFQPLVSMFQDPMHMTTTEGKAPAATVDEAGMANEVMEELVRAVLVQPAVRTAFTEPHRSHILSYRDIKANASGSPPAGAVAHQQTAAEEGGGDAVLTGLVGNVLEEALEELVYQSVVSGVSESVSS